MSWLVIASLIPWAVKLASVEGALVKVIAAVVLVATTVLVVRRYRRDGATLVEDLLFAPVLLLPQLAFAAHGIDLRLAHANLFVASMLLQLYAGAHTRMLTRLGVVLGPFWLTKWLTDQGQHFTVIGLASAGVVSWLLGRAFERQHVLLSRAERLTEAIAGLASAGDARDVMSRTLATCDQLVATAPSHELKIVLQPSEDTPALTETRGGSAGVLGPSLAAESRGERGAYAKVQLRALGAVDRDLFAACSTLANSAAQAMARVGLLRSEHELAIAARIQSALLPRRYELDGFEVACLMRPATEVGGDYYDIIPVEGACYVGVGDVSGHGLPAGLVMLMTQAAMSGLVRAMPRASPRELIVLLNQVLHENIRHRLNQHEHVTFNLLRFDRSGLVTHAGAHEDILVLRSGDSALEHFTTSGTWLGPGPDVSRSTRESSFRLGVGDVVLLHTDGVTEARNDRREQLGLERLARAFAGLKSEPVEAMVSALGELASSWASSCEDDMTILALRYLGPAPRVRESGSADGDAARAGGWS